LSVSTINLNPNLDKNKSFHHINESVSDYCLTSNELFFSHIMARTEYFDEMMMMMSALY